MSQKISHFASYQEIKPGKLILVKFSGYPWWPSFTMDMEYLKDDMFEEKVKQTGCGPVPVHFLVDNSYSWPVLEAMKPATESELRSLKSKKPTHNSAVKLALKIIDEEKKNGTDGFESMLRNGGFIEDDQEYVAPTEFSRWLEECEELGFEITDELERRQAEDTELLTGKKSSPTVSRTSKKRSLQEVEHEEPQTKPKPKVKKFKPTLDKSEISSNKIPSSSSISPEELSEVPSNTKKSSTVTKSLRGLKTLDQKEHRNTSPLTEQEHNPTPINTSEHHQEDLKPLNGIQSFKDLSEHDIESLFIIYRAGLQRALIQRKSIPTIDEYTNASVMLEDVEKMDSEELVNIKVLKTSKIYKVLREMLKLDYKQQEDGAEELDGKKYDVKDIMFKERAEFLLLKWAPLIKEILDQKNKSNQVMVSTVDAVNKNGTIKDPNKPPRKLSTKTIKAKKLETQDTNEIKSITNGEVNTNCDDLKRSGDSKKDQDIEMKDALVQSTESTSNITIPTTEVS